MLNQKIKLAYDDYYTIKAQKDHQDTWLSQLINAISEAKDTPKARLWKQIWQNEEACKWAQQVQQIFNQEQTRSRLTQVNIPDPNKQEGWIMVHDKNNLEHVCLEEAHKRFTQAAVSPILQLPYDKGLHSMGVGLKAFQQILVGTYDMSHITNKYMVKLLLHLGRPPGILDIKLWSETEYAQGQKRQGKPLPLPCQGSILGTILQELKKLS